MNRDELVKILERARIGDESYTAVGEYLYEAVGLDLRVEIEQLEKIRKKEIKSTHSAIMKIQSGLDELMSLGQPILDEDTPEYRLSKIKYNSFDDRVYFECEEI